MHCISLVHLDKDEACLVEFFVLLHIVMIKLVFHSLLYIKLSTILLLFLLGPLNLELKKE